MKITPREAGTLEVPILAGSMDLGTLELRVIVTGSTAREVAELKADALAVMERHLDLQADAHDRGDEAELNELAEVVDVIDRLMSELA
jgi:hypothetical protein